ncbi:hypothetical protein OF83DRAFT_593596 [Amylostereum chailletii]|nr:hypothetical protein OF83DRAFT_593596 [Amylostereum chailletii]
MSGLTSTLKAMSSRRSSASALLRPVLPKPPQQSPSDMAPRVHRPALPRPTLFSPYIRAYNGHFISPDVNSRTLEANVALPPLSSNQPSQLQYNPAAFLSPPQLSTPQPLSSTDFPDFSQWSTLPDFGDLGTMSCICGDACSCPGCIQHRGMAAWFNRGCAHPENCTTCLPPVPTSTHPSTPPTTPLGDDPAVNFATLAEWMRNIPNEGSAAPGFNVNEDVGFDVFGTPINSYPVESFMDIDPALPGPSSFQGSSSALSENDMDPSLFSFAMSNSEPNSSSGGSDPTLMFDFEGSSSLSPGVPSARRRASSTSSLSSFSPSMEGHSAGLDQTHYERSSPHKPKASSTTSLLPLSPLSVTNIFSSRSATDVARASGGGVGIGGDPTSSVGQSEGQRTRQNASVHSRGRGAARATFYQAATGRMG